MRKRILLVVPFAVLVIGLAVVVGRAAAHGDDSDLIHACVNDASGEIKIVDANDACPNSSTALDWNPQHPILVLPGENGIDLSGLDCNPQILFFSDDSLGQARLVYECPPKAFSFRVPDGADGERRIFSVSNNLLDLLGMTGDPTLQITDDKVFTISDGDTLQAKFGAFTGFGLGDSPNGAGMMSVGGVRLTADGNDVITLFMNDDFGCPGALFINNKDGLFMTIQPGRIHYFGTADGTIQIPNGMKLNIDDEGAANIFEFSDGLLDMSGMSSDPLIRMPSGSMNISADELLINGDDKLLLDINQFTAPNGTEFYVMSLVEDERGQAAMEYRTDLNQFTWIVPIVRSQPRHRSGSTLNSSSYDRLTAQLLPVILLPVLRAN